jgi:hypothetical protein
MGFVRALAPPVLPTPHNVAYNRAEAAASPRGEFLAILWQKVPPQGQGRVLTSLDRTSQIPIQPWWARGTGSSPSRLVQRRS